MNQKLVSLSILCALALVGCSSQKNAPMIAPEGDSASKSIEPNGPGGQRNSSSPPVASGAGGPTASAASPQAGGPTAGPTGQPGQNGGRQARVRTEKPTPDKTVEGVYKVTEGSRTVEVMGVCKMADKNVVCWDPKGAPLPELAKQILEQATEMRVPLDPQPDGEKLTRMVVTKISGEGGDTRADLRFVGTETFGPGFSIRGPRTESGPTGGFNMQRIQLFRVPAGTPQTTASFEFRTPSGAEFSITPTKGATAAYQGKKVTLTDIVAGTEGNRASATELIFTVEGGVPEDMNAQVNFFDSKGEPIRRMGGGGMGRRVMLPGGESPRGGGPGGGGGAGMEERAEGRNQRSSAGAPPRAGGSDANVRFGGFSVKDGKIVLRVFGDLKSLGKITFVPNKVKNVDIAKIAVNPK